MVDFKKYLARFFPRDVLGLDVGARAARLVSVKKMPDGPHLDRIAKIPLLRQAEGDEAFVDALRGTLREMSLADRWVAINIEDPSLRIRRIDLPEMPESQLLEAIKWNLKENPESEEEELVVRYSNLPGVIAEDKIKIPYVTYGIRQDAVEKKRNLLLNLGMRPAAIEPNASAILAAFDASEEWEGNQKYVVMEMGETKTLFLVVGAGSIFFSRPLGGISGEALTKQIARHLAVDSEKAEEYKLAFSVFLVDNKLEQKMPAEVSFGSDVNLAKVGLAMQHFMGQLSTEVQRSIDAFRILFRNEKVEKIFLCGGASQVVNMSYFMARTLNLPTFYLDPFKKLQWDIPMVRDFSAHAPEYAVAVGLALQ